MAGANLSFENAPRDVEQLMGFGRYSLRNLAYEIGMISKDDPAAVTAFDKLSLRERAQNVFNALAQLDKKNSAESGEKPAPKGKREPVRPKEDKPAAAKKEPVKEPVKTNGGGVEAVLLEQLAELKKVVEAQGQVLATVRSQLQMVIRISKANMYMNGLVGEHIMQGDINDMISDGFAGGKSVEIPNEAEGN